MIKCPSKDIVNKKPLVTAGLIFEFTVFSQLKVPVFKSIEKILFLLFEKYKDLSSATKSETLEKKQTGKSKCFG